MQDLIELRMLGLNQFVFESFANALIQDICVKIVAKNRSFVIEEKISLGIFSSHLPCSETPRQELELEMMPLVFKLLSM